MIFRYQFNDCHRHPDRRRCWPVLLRQRWISRLIDGEPTIIVENGKPLHERLRRARLLEVHVMEAARSSRGIEKLAEIKFAILERNGKISVIAQED